ncbi:MAG: MEKHLA domain-containing protein [Hormoscilla sp. GM102CHS1]|nr:MEKHLA domain-containing protein [Hormoscilla sp. GM102CHS1]
MVQEVWQQPEIITWSQLLLDSYEKLLGHQLIERKDNAQAQAQALFFAPLVVASHGTEADPILNYRNQKALDLWDMTWDNFTKTPSRMTAESVNREERKKMFAQVAKQGFIDNYRGVRIASTGKRFLIEKAIVWNLFEERDRPCGQGATFSKWYLLND